MNVAVCHGESGGCSVGPFPLLRTLLAGVAVFCALLAWSAPALAGSLYRCIGAHDETVFASSASGYSHCHRLHDIAAQTPRAHPAPAAVKASTPVATRASAKSPHTTSSGHWVYRQSAPGHPLGVGHGANHDVHHSSTRILRGAVYRVKLADGSTEYTNVRPQGHHSKAVKTLFSYIATCVACDIRSNIDWHTVPLHTTDYATTIRNAAAEYGVSTSLLRAVIHAESAFNPRALSSKGAQGLMQLMPNTASEMGVDNPFDAVQNIRGGARYLARLLHDFHGNERLAEAAYNAGPQAVRKYGHVPPYPETRVYVKRVGILRKRYAAVLASADLPSNHGPAG